MVVAWILLFVVALVAVLFSSRRAVSAALEATAASSLSPAFIGATILAVGTDLPEIANSVVAALSGHGDIALGDTAGSALTQVTLILAILCFAMTVRSDTTPVLAIGSVTVGALILVAVLVADGELSRADGLLLILLWLASVVLVRRPGGTSEPVRHTARRPEVRRHLLRTFSWLVMVAVAATLVVSSFVEITDRLGVPELVASAVVLSIGTSLPELVVDWTAIRRGAMALALGDLFGSSLVDATLALGAGPALRAIDVSDGAVAVSLIAAGGVAGATIVASTSTNLGRRSAAALLAIYLVAIGALLAVGG